MKRGKSQPPQWGWLIAFTLVAITAGIALGLSLRSTPVPAEGNPTITPEATIPIQFKPETTPQQQPSITFQINIIDATTGRPVAARIWVAGTLANAGTAKQNVVLNLANTNPKAIAIRVEADGYQTWDKVLRFKVLYDRIVPVDVELQPLYPPAQSGI
jgi:hypothetical protein